MVNSKATPQVNAESYKNLLENTYYFNNGGFYKWDFTKNSWQSPPEGYNVYEYIDYMTGVRMKWNQEANEWQQIQAPIKPQDSSNLKKLQKEKEKEKQIENEKKPATWFEVNDDKNTNVYVSGLPLDITDEEFEEMMSKYGIITKDPLTYKLKAKLYRDNDEVKGDGRCCYLMPESVKLCLQLLDGSIYKDHVIKVEKAKFEQKGKYDPSRSIALENQLKKKKLNKNKEKKLLEKQRQKYN
jgi:HIV Tat-specific factor 1